MLYMTSPVNLFSQRIYKEHPTFNWTLQKGTTTIYNKIDSPGVMSSALGFPPPGDIDSPIDGTGYIWYNSQDWKREGIPMVVGSDGTTEVLPNSPRFEANRFLNSSGRYDTFVFEFWMRLFKPADTFQQIICSSDFIEDESDPCQYKNYSHYGLYIKDTVLVFVYGRTHCAYDIQVPDQPALISLFVGPKSIAISVNGETVASSTIFDVDLNHKDTTIDQPLPDCDDFGWKGYDFYFSQNGVSHSDPSEEDGLIEIDAPALYGYFEGDNVSKRRYAWGQAVKNVQLINNLFDGDSAYSELATSNASRQVFYPNNYSWNSSANLDNLYVGDNVNKLTFIPPTLPDTVFSDDKTFGSWIFNFDNTGYKYDSTVSTSFDKVSDFIKSPVSLFFEGGGVDIVLTSSQYPGYEVRISSGIVKYRLVDDESEPYTVYDESIDPTSNGFILNFASFDDGQNLEISNMLHDLNFLEVSIIGPESGEGAVCGLGFASEVHAKIEERDIDSNFIEAWNSTTTVDGKGVSPNYFWTFSGHVPFEDNELNFNYFFPDVALQGYWEDYVPVELLSGVDNNNELVEPGYLQFNMSHVGDGVKFYYQNIEDFGNYPSWTKDATEKIDNDRIQKRISNGDTFPFNDIFMLYIRMKTDGWFSYPCQLNKMSLLAHNKNEVLGTSGLSIRNNTDNDFLYDIDSSPYLTLGKNTGFSQAGTASKATFDVLVGDVGSVGAIQTFFKWSGRNGRQDFMKFQDSTGVGFSSSLENGLISVDSGTTVLIDGKVVDSIPRLGKDEWHCVAFVFEDKIETNEDSKITCTLSSSNFENVGYFLDKGSHEKNVEVMRNVWKTYTLSEPLLVQGSQPLELIQSDVAAYPGVSWQQIDIEPL